VDFSRVHVWWAEDAFLPEGHPLRNETRARAVMQGVIAMPPTHVHSVPPAAPAFDVQEATQRYVEDLAQQGDGGPLPAFDVVLLGVGPRGEVAALSPDSPQVRVSDRMVTSVDGAPAQAPTRITLTLPALCSGRQVWLVAAGASAVDAVRTMWHGVPDNFACPASLARGQESTLLLADAAAVAGLER
jgi:6-phosphogluconolactonase